MNVGGRQQPAKCGVPHLVKKPERRVPTPLPQFLISSRLRRRVIPLTAPIFLHRELQHIGHDLLLSVRDYFLEVRFFVSGRRGLVVGLSSFITSSAAIASPVPA